MDHPAPALPLREPLLRALKEQLDKHPRRVTPEIPERRQAAVLIPLFERGGEPWVVLTKRTETVSTHKGQISFPGGGRDATDADLWTTALREAEEEMGIDPAGVQQLGALDDYPTFAADFIVSPFIGAIEPGGWRPNPHEIAEVIETPLSTLAEVGRMEVWDRDGFRFPMHIFDLGEHRVWGLTAFILRRFLDIVAPVLRGDHRAAGRPSDDLAATVVKELAAVDDRFDWVGIYWVEGEDLVLGPYVGAHPEGHEVIRIPEGVCGAVAAGGQTEVVPDVRARPGHIACDLRTRSEVVVPIIRGGAVIGVLDVDSDSLDAFGREETAAVESAASLIGSSELSARLPQGHRLFPGSG